MLDIDLPLSSAIELNPQTAARICEDAFDLEDLVESLDAGDPFTRKDLCEYLGIGESTLSGWIKEGRIPRMARNAIALLGIQQMLAAELRRLGADDLRVVRAGNHFQVCELLEDEEGELTGRVIADHIPTIEDARLLASGRRAMRLLRRVDDAGLVEYALEMSANQAFLRGVKEVEREITEHELFVTDHEKWRAEFGRKSSLVDLDDHLSDEQPPQEK
jgi:hypothetical protein